MKIKIFDPKPMKSKKKNTQATYKSFKGELTDSVEEFYKVAIKKNLLCR